ncbi:uncharacterized protein LOC129090139 [Anoplopoma fimbria]|uniref:uncharacterized protein LOC129090139 n=1 Tax=Anoplopoma fimbria TaxID=229290 RepID=UPI0023ED7465|nr:uncharacterized protein LOC129090139 [Anoplopoma fimbria]
MLLFYATLACVLCGGSSSDVTLKEKCYGKSLSLPFSYTPPIFFGQMYFTPRNGGSTKLLMDNGEAKHPRLKVSLGSVKFTDLTERDEGTFSISKNNDERQDVIILTIKDCASKEMGVYWDKHSFDLPREAEFLEYTPLHSVDQPKVLWNRTDPQTNEGGRGRMRNRVWEIKNLIQADMGHYNLRAKDNTLLFRKLLEVRERYMYYDTQVNKRLLIANLPGFQLWTVDFSSEEEEENQTLMHAGHLRTDNYWYSGPFKGRLFNSDDGLEIDPVESTDSGTYYFRDEQGNLAQTTQVLVNPEPVATMVYVGIAVGSVFAVIACCCCVRKCCCKKSSSKRAESAPQTAATPTVYYHGTNQPTGRSYSAAPALDHSTHYSVNSLASREPTTISLEPPVYNPANINVNPPQPKVAPLGGQGVHPAPSLGSDCLSSDPDITFKLKGATAALPLSSGSTFCDVYVSDKLNFL